MNYQNNITSIKKKCVLDHIDYIKSYIHKNKTCEILADYKKGVERYAEIKTLMRDITLHHPQLMSFMLNPNDSQICKDDICKNIVYQHGGSCINLNLDHDVEKTVESVNTILKSFKSSDLVKMEKVKNDLLNRFNNIDSQLTILKKDIRTDVDTNNMIDIIDDVINTIFYCLNLIGSDKDSTVIIIKKIITILISDKNINQLISELFVVKSNSIQLQNDLCSDLIETLIQKLNHSLHVDLTDAKIMIMNELIYPIISDQSYNGIKTDKSYNEIKTHIDVKIIEISKLNKHFELSTNQINDYLYGESPDNIKSFASIRSNILPRPNEIVNVMRMYIDNISTVNSSTVNSSTVNSSTVNSSFDNSFDNSSYLKIKMLIDNFDNHNSDSYDQSKILMLHLNAYDNELNKSQPNSIKLLKHIQLFVNELIDTKHSYSALPTSFIKMYNSLMDKNIVDNLNIFLAEMYRTILIKLLNSEPINSRNAFTKLNLQKARNIANKTFTIHEFSTIKDMFNDLLLNVDSINIADNLRFLNELREEKHMIDLLSSKIKTEKDARMFIHAYNISVYGKNLDILMNVEMSPCIKMIPYVYFLQDHTEHIHNNIFENIDIHCKHKMDILENLIYESNRLIIETPNLTEININIDNLIQCINVLSILCIKYIDNRKKYDISYNNMYMYMRYLILISTNQFFTDNYVVYRYLNKDIINHYKKITNKMVRDKNLDKILQDSRLSTVNNRIKNYYNIVLRHINCFLNKMSVFMIDSTDLIDITNLDSTSADIRNDMLILNYFKPVIEFYNRSI